MNNFRSSSEEQRRRTDESADGGHVAWKHDQPASTKHDQRGSPRGRAIMESKELVSCYSVTQMIAQTCQAFKARLGVCAAPVLYLKLWNNV
ncbi:hypothetical protein NDU88_002388 [Pleurodeles waltl]|uniref:Uncharacterized protein n=1 Tax=Pleurodeles waltl TaxID=8319 RepID=A0AAV7M5U7_PLEWA|nr:hypothetical protein NDU88_002388 [Pleurodeles waltl]